MADYSVRWRPIFALAACVTAYSVMLGLIYPLIAMRLDAQGYGAGLIGFNAAMTPLGFILSAPFTPRLASRVRPYTLLLWALISSSALLAGIGVVTSFAAWSVLRLLLGVTTNVLFVVGETLLMEMAPASHRGRVMGSYNGIITLGYAVGPALLAWFGTDTSTPFIITVGIVLSALLLLIASRSMLIRASIDSEQPSSIRAFMVAAPILIAGCAATALFDNAGMSLFPLFSISQGISAEVSLRLLTAMLIGGVVLQYPLGWLADRFEKTWLLTACALVTIAGAVFMLSVEENAHGYMLVFLWGGAAFGVYSMVLALMSERFRGEMLVAGNAALALTWGLGSFVGVPITGAAIEVVGTNSYPLIVSIPFLVVVMLIWTSSFRRPGHVHSRIS